MKKNLLGAIVIIFVTFACLLVMSEVSNNDTSEVETQQYYADTE
jgi:multisubunit Na+/H+ antiporter MnhC subunit